MSPTSYTYTGADAGSHNFTVTFGTLGTFPITATSGSVTGSEVNILVEDSIVILNKNDSTARFTEGGVQIATFGSTSGASTYGSLAFDNAGNIWATQQDANTVVEFTSTGSSVAVAGNSAAGVSSPVAIFIDGAGQAWIADKTSNSVSVLSNAGAAVSPSTGYQNQSGTLSSPTGLVVDGSGSVWITNSASNSVTKIIGAAAPVVTPTITGTTNKTLGTEP